MSFADHLLALNIFKRSKKSSLEILKMPSHGVERQEVIFSIKVFKKTGVK